MGCHCFSFNIFLLCLCGLYYALSLPKTKESRVIVIISRYGTSLPEFPGGC
uniref:Uncharacterized protein n=1 Tax=Rhizophora mucronata TaxID=61149 RepID=A0A2P2PYA1_RHIMU